MLAAISGDLERERPRPVSICVEFEVVHSYKYRLLDFSDV
jgi:hypothetical protein